MLHKMHFFNLYRASFFFYIQIYLSKREICNSTIFKGMNVYIYICSANDAKKGKTEKKGYHVRYECKMRMEYIVYVVGYEQTEGP